MRTVHVLLLMNDNYRENFIAFRWIPFRYIAFRTLVYFVSFRCIHFISFRIIVNFVSLRCVSFGILEYLAAFRNISFRFVSLRFVHCVSISFRSLVQPCKMRNETRNETCATERNEINRKEIDRNETKRNNTTYINETISWGKTRQKWNETENRESII